MGNSLYTDISDNRVRNLKMTSIAAIFDREFCPNAYAQSILRHVIAILI